MTDNHNTTASATIATVPPPVVATKTSSRTEQQMRKLRDANAKYKDLLKLAKGRIQSQEEEFENVKSKKREKDSYFIALYCIVLYCIINKCIVYRIIMLSTEMKQQS